MATYTKISLQEVQSLASAHGIDGVCGIEGISAGSVNSNYWARTEDGVSFFLRIYEEQNVEGAAEEWRLLAFLGNHDVPVPQVVAPLRTASPLSYAGKPVAFFKEVFGTELCSARTAPSHLECVGVFLGRLHQLAFSYERPKPGRFEVDGLLARIASARTADRPELVADLDFIETEMLAQTGKALDADLPTTVIHGDLFRDNIRFENGNICAVLDWESASLGLPGYDIMVVLLAWCYGDDFDQERMRSLMCGYQSIRPLSRPEILSLHAIACQACLRFATTRITDFYLRAEEGVQPSRDYRRFLSRFRKLQELGAEGFVDLLGL